jgi:cyclopropane fatty-acyl-phospholipid synthase-like methyltransferase
MSPPTRLAQATFHGPLSEARAARLVERVTRSAPRTVLDVGCGWGELLLRVLAAAPAATGVGIDLNAGDLARGRTNAAARGLAGRVEFVEESGHGTTRGPADLVLCLGASQALSGAPAPALFVEALNALRTLVNPGGRVLWGEGFWQRAPSPAELARMWPDASIDDHTDLHGLTELAVAAGFRPAWTETANADEWEEFESAYQADAEEWLAARPADPQADAVRRRLDEHRAAWLTGYRDVFGLAYLTLVPVA